MRTLTVLMLSAASVAAAAPLPMSQLMQLIQNPVKPQPRQIELLSRGDGAVTERWSWNEPLDSTAIQLSRLRAQPQQWELILHEKAYPLKTVAPTSTLLATIHVNYIAKDTGFKIENLSYLYAIPSGPFKGRCLER